MWTLLLLLLTLAGAASAQFDFEKEPERGWLPPVMSVPTKLSPDRLVDDEYPSIARDAAGRVWVAWSSCRTQSAKLPQSRTDLDAWQWPDDGQDVVVARFFDGKDWSEEHVVSGVAGVNHRPAVVPDGAGVRVLWTARRGGVWAAYERRWENGTWREEQRLEASEGSLEVRARRLEDGSLLAVISTLAPPRIELRARVFRGGRWLEPVRLDEGQGRCHRPSLLALPGGQWMVAWDEERDGNYDVYIRPSSGPVQRVAGGELWETAPSLARAPDGRIWIAWERKETQGGRFTYQGRSIFGKFFDGARWQWAPSPFGAAEPGRLTRHSPFWATHGFAEERYPQLAARPNGEVWLFWLGGGRMSSTSFSGRVWKNGRWSEPRLVFHDPVPYPAFALPSARRGQDLRSRGRGPYQTPLCNQMALALDPQSGQLWMAYEVPKRRHITDADLGDQSQPTGQVQARAAGFGADIYCHWADLDERQYRLPRVVDEETPIPPPAPRPYRKPQPATVTIGGEQYQLVFGDLHGHTENDALGALDMYYAHGLMVAGMDFVASTNHDFTPDFLTQSEWAYTQALATVYNRIPGRAAFSGWEWTTAPSDARGGHRALYYLADNGPLYRSTTVPSNTVEKLYRLLRGMDVVLQPHHRGWEGYDPQLQPVVEITSAWREPREEGGNFQPQGKVRSAWEALERGYRVGFVGSGDTHWLAPGEDNGITGAYVKRLTREDIFEAIRSRRVFASTGARALVDFRVNGAFMGSETRAAGPPRLEVSVTGDGDVEQVEIVRDHRIIHAAPGAGRKVAFEFVDQGGAAAGRPVSYYYVRARQKNGGRVWSSPVWVAWQR